jgi:hypothetical protein
LGSRPFACKSRGPLDRPLDPRVRDFRTSLRPLQRPGRPTCGERRRGYQLPLDQALTIKGRDPNLTIVIGVDDFIHGACPDDWTLVILTLFGTIRLTPTPHRDLPAPPYEYDLFIDKQSGHP